MQQLLHERSFFAVIRDIKVHFLIIVTKVWCLVCVQSYLTALQSVCLCPRTQTPGWETPWSSVRNKTHISIMYIIVWHWSPLNHRTPDTHIHKTYCRLFTFSFSTPTTTLCTHTSTPHITHTHSSGSFTFFFHHYGVLIGCWISRQRWLVIYIFFLSALTHSYGCSQQAHSFDQADWTVKGCSH